MNIGKGKLIAASSLAAIGGVAAIALGTQPEATTLEPAASAEPTKPKIKTEVVHRVKHVQAEATPAAAGSAAAPAAVAVPASAPVSAPAPEPMTAPAPAVDESSVEDAYEDEEDSYENEDDSYEDEDDDSEDSGGEDVDD